MIYKGTLPRWLQPTALTIAILALLIVSASLEHLPALRRITLGLVVLLCIREVYLRRLNWGDLHPYIPWSLVILFSSLWSRYPYKTLVDSFWLSIGPMAAGLVTMSLVARTRGQALYPLAIALLGSSILGLLAALYGEKIFSWPDWPWLGGYYAEAVHSSTRGALMCFIGLWITTIPSTQRHKHWRSLGVALMLVGLLLGWPGYHRTFGYSLLIGLLLWWRLCTTCPIAKNGLLYLTGVLVAVALIVLASAFRTALDQPVLGSYQKDPRWTIWQSWWSVFLDRPWWGYGFSMRNINEIGRRSTFLIAEMNEFGYYNPHNLILNVLLQTGTFGMLAFLWLLLGVVRGAWNEVKARVFSKPAYWQGVALLSLLISFLINSLTNDTFWYPVNVVFWICVGIVSGMSAPHRNSQN